MRAVWALLWLLVAGAAAADPYCRPDATEMASLPARLAGDWQGVLVQGVAVVAGQPRAMPSNPADLPAKVSAIAGGIMLADAQKPAAWDLMAATGDADFALPGETPLRAEEMLAPLVTEAGADCPALDLPQFLGALPEAQGMAGSIHLYALSDRTMLMVFLFNEAGEPRKNGVRAVLRYRR